MYMCVFARVFVCACVSVGVCALHLGHHSVRLVGGITSYTSNSSASVFLPRREVCPVLIDDIRTKIHIRFKQ